jgi:hypothetical protein
MRLLATRRVNLLQVSQEQSSKVDDRLGHDTVALEIECSPSGCSSPTGWLKIVEYQPLELPYCLKESNARH